MRRGVLAAPMITLLLLSGCGGAGEQGAEELALSIRDDLAAAQQCSMDAAVTADYGERIYDYNLHVEVSKPGEAGEETVLTLTEPETVAGITARLKEDSNTLEYDGVSVETGPLGNSGLSPMEAIPAILTAAREGYITGCTLEKDGSLLRVDYGAFEGEPGTGTEVTVWFDTANRALTAGEIRVDGYRSISCEFSGFSAG